uniref:Uncharacterized protein n=1 Tax=Nothobranchius pienaari TaxID=704102 RepID=A0A1A8MQ01_9TELE
MKVRKKRTVWKQVKDQVILK